MNLYKIDDNGLLEYKEHRFVSKPQIEIIDEEGNSFFVDDLKYIDVDPPTNLIWPKWSNNKWIEGGTAPEPTPPLPTLEERLDLTESILLELMMG